MIVNEFLMIYFGIALIWIFYFVKKRAFALNKWQGWVGAILATFLWPLGFVLLFAAIVRQKRCSKCNDLKRSLNS